jgi:hypothetical protein
MNDLRNTNSGKEEASFSEYKRLNHFFLMAKPDPNTNPLQTNTTKSYRDFSSFSTDDSTI